MKTYFDTISAELDKLCRAEEVYLCNLRGENSDFVRFNQGKIRQAGTVTQHYLTLDLIEQDRHALGSIALTGQLYLDRPRIMQLIEDLRQQRQHLTPDPHLLYATQVNSSCTEGENRLPPKEQALADIFAAIKETDFVGIYASGLVYRGFANSFGQRNWHTNYSFNLDWCLYHHADKAVKCNYAGQQWQMSALLQRMEKASAQLSSMALPARGIKPGDYRVYFAPAALNDIVLTVARGGFSYKAHHTKHSPLLQMSAEGRMLHTSVALRENTQEGLAPHFQDAGYTRPKTIDLITDGRYSTHLISPRSAKEFAISPNGAASSEMPQSLDMAPGQLSSEEVLKTLDTGLYVNNVWYLNYSDRPHCRLTGMTRFATFWVEQGEIKAPLSVMRFDDTLYRLLGDELVDLTREREFIADPGTYEGRSLNSSHIPGALIANCRFTL